MKINEVCDSVQVPYWYLECARKKRQVNDIAFAAQMFVEKGLDSHSVGGLAAADIARFYDGASALKVVEWLIGRGFHPRLAILYVRMHGETNIRLTVGSISSTIGHRSIGLLTGSRSANSGARAVMIDAVLAVQHEIEPLCFVSQSLKLIGIASFVDNLFAFGPTASNAIRILQLVEIYISNKWHLSFGPDSKQYMVPDGSPVVQPSLNGFARVEALPCLGHVVSSTANCIPCFTKVRKSMWATFWRNNTPALRSLRLPGQIRFLSQHVLSIARARWSRWGYSSELAKYLDSLQARMIAILIDAKPMPLEPFEAFCQRRLRQAGTVMAKHGKFSSVWASDVCNWHKHIVRAHDSTDWCNQLLLHKRLSFIDSCRILFSSNGNRRTRTRRRIGGVAIRWETGFLKARDFLVENPLIRTRFTAIENAPVTRTAILEQLEAIHRQLET